MGKRIKKASFWIRRRSYLATLIVGGFVILLLFFNDDTSFSKNMEYQEEITQLKKDIQLNKDSAAYYREKRMSVLAGKNELERLAREQFNMQKPTEDVYIVR